MASTSSTSKASAPVFQARAKILQKQDVGTGDDRQFSVALSIEPNDGDGVRAMSVTLRVDGQTADAMELAKEYTLTLSEADAA